MEFRRLVIPVFLAIGLSVAALMVTVIYLASEEDEIALQNEGRSLKLAVANLRSDFEALAEDYAWWDDFVVNTLMHYDKAWVDRNVGAIVDGTLRVDTVLIVGYAGADLGTYIPTGMPSRQAWMQSTAGRVILATARNPALPTRSGFVQIGGELYLVVVSPALPTSEMPAWQDLPPDRHATLVTIRAMKSEDWIRVGESANIDSLRLADGSFSRMEHVLYGIDEAPIASLTWTPREPGRRMLLNAATPTVILLVLLGLVLALFVRRASALVHQLETASRSKSDFLASMSHEIRTPMTAILGFTDLLKSETFGPLGSEKNREYLGLVAESGQHLLAIINDILDLSKLEAGRFELSPDQVDPSEIVEAVLGMFEAAAGMKEITFEEKCEFAQIESDARVMRQVLINVVSNALKFTPTGGTISITGELTSTRYAITVTDTGYGMSDEDLSRAMEIFGQADDIRVRRQQGTGLGLPLVQRFMQLMGGSLDIQSRLGEGTIVRLNFPLAGLPRKGKRRKTKTAGTEG